MKKHIAISVLKYIAISVLIILACGFTIVLWYVYTGDYSPRLSGIAKTGFPIIQKATEFCDKNGRPPTAAELRLLVGDPFRFEGDDKLSNTIRCPKYPDSEWWYSLYPGTDVNGFMLFQKIQMDEALQYDYDGKEGTWGVRDEDNGWNIKIIPYWF